MKEIKEIAKLAKQKLNLVPELKKKGVVILTKETYENSVISYISEQDGYYQIIEDNGQNVVKKKVADTEEQIIIYIVDKYINEYASKYELANRHRYEDHMRQVYEVKNRCWQYIDKSNMQEYINDDQADNIVRMTDLISDYRNIAYDILQNTRDIPRTLREYIEYLVQNLYKDNENNISSDYKRARSAIEFIVKEYTNLENYNNDIVENFEKLQSIHNKVI